MPAISSQQNKQTKNIFVTDTKYMFFYPVGRDHSHVNRHHKSSLPVCHKLFIKQISQYLNYTLSNLFSINYKLLKRKIHLDFFEKKLFANPICIVIEEQYITHEC